MWVCVKCGHKSSKRTSSSYGCNHEWRDEDELAAEMAEWKAERKRELSAFNDELLNTESGKKLLNGKDGYDWLLTEKAKRWLDSSFGKDWLSSESGKAYLNYMNEKDEKKLEELMAAFKEYKNQWAEFNALEKKERNKKTGCACAIVIAYFSAMWYFAGKGYTIIFGIMLLLSAIVFLITYSKKEWLSLFFMVVVFIISLIAFRMLFKYGIIAG